MEQLKKYPKYKNSGIAWLGEIPEHWEVRRLKYMAYCFPSNVDKHTREGEEKVMLCNYTDVYKNDFITENMKFMVSSATQQQIEKFRLREDDLLITKDSETSDDIAVPAYVTKDFENVICGYHLSIIRSYIDVSGKYLFRLFQHKKFNSQFEICANGVTRVGLGVYDLNNAFATYPPLSEQTKIAAFLDYKLAKIDRFIRKKKQLIKLLNEQKAAIINQAVTKGLDPNANMKPSGVEWLGDIPEHWELWKMSRAYKVFSSGTTPESGNASYYENGTIPWVNTADLNDDILYESRKFVTEKALDKYSVLKINPKGTLSVAMYGATIGKISILDFEATTNQACCNFSQSNILVDEYTFFWFIANRPEIISLGYGGGQPNISQSLVKTLKITTPPINEQNEIIDFIKQQKNQTNSIIVKIEKEITLTQEYKTALIAEAVTGKIDVRDFVIPEVIAEEEGYEDLEEELSMSAEGEVAYENEDME